MDLKRGGHGEVGSGDSCGARGKGTEEGFRIV